MPIARGLMHGFPCASWRKLQPRRSHACTSSPHRIHRWCVSTADVTLSCSVSLGCASYCLIICTNSFLQSLTSVSSVRTRKDPQGQWSVSTTVSRFRAHVQISNALPNNCQLSCTNSLYVTALGGSCKDFQSHLGALHAETHQSVPHTVALDLTRIHF